MHFPSPSVFHPNVVEIDADGHLLTGGRSGFAAGYEAGQPNLKAITEAPRLTTVSETDYATLSEATLIIPHWKTEWVWGAGTSNFFRRPRWLSRRPTQIKFTGMPVLTITFALSFI